MDRDELVAYAVLAVLGVGSVVAILWLGGVIA